MKVIITGASGQLGRAFVHAFADTDVCACAWSRARENHLKVDLTHREAVLKTVATLKPELIIHSAAIRQPDICENNRPLTDKVNVSATTYLTEAAAVHNSALLYVSTDYVFDGSTPPYSVDDKPNPLNYYGKSKLDGEKAALKSTAKVAVLRLPILYGEVESLGESAVTSLGLLLLQTESILVDHWATRYPTYVDDVAVTVRRWADKLIENQHTRGIYHFSANEPFTKYDMISVMGRLISRDFSHIIADTNPPDGAPRPKDAHLDDARLATEVELRKTPFEGVIGNILKPHFQRNPMST